MERELWRGADSQMKLATSRMCHCVDSCDRKRLHAAPRLLRCSVSCMSQLLGSRVTAQSTFQGIAPNNDWFLWLEADCISGDQGSHSPTFSQFSEILRLDNAMNLKLHYDPPRLATKQCLSRPRKLATATIIVCRFTCSLLLSISALCRRKTSLTRS